MNVNSVLKRAQHADRNLQRWRQPQTRSVLINSRTEVNYMCAAPIYLAMKNDARVQFYFAATDDSAKIDQIYREADQDILKIGAGQAAMKRFDAYLTSDFMGQIAARIVPHTDVPRRGGQVQF